MMAHMALNTQPGLSETWHWAHQNGHDWRVADPECYLCIAQALASEASKAMQGQLEQLSLCVVALACIVTLTVQSLLCAHKCIISASINNSTVCRQGEHATADMCHCLMQAQSCCWHMQLRSTACRCKSKLAMLSCAHVLQLVLPLTGRPAQQRHWPCCMVCMHLCQHPSWKPSLLSHCASLPILTMACQPISF